MGIRWYIIKRLLNAIPVLFSVLVIAFFLVRLAPGDPAVLMAGEGATEEYLDLMREKYGLNDPIWIQFGRQMKNFLTGDWGKSWTFERPVLDVIIDRIPQTLLLVGVGLTLAIIFGIFLGLAAARVPYSLKDNLITFFSFLGFSLPVFWFAQILVLVFGIKLGWLPPFGLIDYGVNPESKLFWGWTYTKNILKHLILPATALATVFLATYTKLTRAGLLEVQRQNFIMAARAKGVPEDKILRKHGLRNALLPVITVAGIQFGVAIAGVVLTETVFAWPGVGRLLYDALLFRDYPLVMGTFVFVSLSVVFFNILADILYAWVDPRITYT
ncbi:MAG: ABC transporter permease [Candidatus Heimdallarchaeota archaeon]